MYRLQNSNVAKANCAINGSRLMEAGLLDDTDDDKHNGAGFVGVSTLFATENAFYFGTEPSGII